MAQANISLVIPEADIADAKAAAISFTGLPATATAKEFLAAIVNIIVANYRLNHATVPTPKVE